MNRDLLLQHFDRISEAPDAIPRLRRFILDLAVRGKLVEQDPHDESATELLKRIQAEKARLVREGEIKDPKELTKNTTEFPYKLPASWQWVPLGITVNSHLGGGTPSKNNSNYWDGDIFWASVKDIGKGKYVDETIDRISNEGLKDSSSNLIPPGNLIVVTRMGLGKISINRVPIAINQDLRALSLSSHSSIDYFYNFFKTHGYEGSGLTVKGIRVEELLNTHFPLPPLAEQHRIVAKVDELMVLCDQLEAERNKREARRDRLVASSLNRISTTTAEEAKDAAQFHFDHLPRLTTRIKHIKQLRQAILNLAVRGRLVPQDPNDEPAAELLKRIQAEKAGLTPRRQDAKKGKKGKKDSGSLGSLAPWRETGFDLPVGWEWVILNNLSKLVTSGSRGWAEFYSDTGPKFIRAQNIRFGKLHINNLVSVNPPQNTEGARTLVSKGDLLIVITGAGVTNPAFVDKELGEAYVSQHVALIKPTKTDLSRWFLLCLMAPDGGRSELVECAYGSGKPGLNLDNIRSLKFPLPPLAEQHRIVAKVDELMALCDQLETQLTTTEADSRRLLEAVLRDALDTSKMLS